MPEMRGRRRLLFLTDVCPLPLDSGQRVRISNLLASCAAVFDVTLLSPAALNGADRQTLEAGCERVAWVETPTNAAAHGPRVWLATARTVPGAWRPRTLEMFAPFAQALARLDLSLYDLVWAERPHIARLCGPLRARTILDLDDLEHRRIRDAARLLGTGAALLELPANLYRYLLYRHLELRWSRAFLASVVCSPEDQAYLQRHGCSNAIVVLNGTATVAARSYCHDTERPLRLVFLGNIVHRPNRDGLVHFIERILPPLRRVHPSVRFDVIGAGESELPARYSNDVNFRGFVPDLAEAL